MRACFLLLPACAAPEPGAELVADPPSGPASGGYALALDLSAAGVDASAVIFASIAGVRAYDLQADGDVLTAQVQGGPAGAAEIALTTAERTARFSGAFSYEEPIDPVFSRVAALGASLTQGVQGGVPSLHGALNSPAAWVARQGGGWLPLPLLVPDLFPQLGPQDVGAAPGCAVPDVVGFVASAAAEVLPQLMDPATGEFGFQHARIDPDLAPRNVAVGGFRAGDTLRGPSEFGPQFVAHLVYDPYGGLGEAPPLPPIALVEAMEPTLILSADLYGNDAINALLSSEGVDLAQLTDPAALDQDLAEIVDRLAATGAEVFLATLPRPSILPVVAENRGRLLASGQATAEEFDAAVAAVDAYAAERDAALIALAERHPNVHVVDLAAAVEALAAEGLTAGGQDLSAQKLGGLLTVDGVHFSDTGYAWTAGLFLDAVAQATGSQAPRIDLDAVAQGDPWSPAALAAGGLDPGCAP